MCFTSSAVQKGPVAIMSTPAANASAAPWRLFATRLNLCAAINCALDTPPYPRRKTNPKTCDHFNHHGGPGSVVPVCSAPGGHPPAVPPAAVLQRTAPRHLQPQLRRPRAWRAPGAAPASHAQRTAPGRRSTGKGVGPYGQLHMLGWSVNQEQLGNGP